MARQKNKKKTSKATTMLGGVQDIAYDQFQTEQKKHRDQALIVCREHNGEL